MKPGYLNSQMEQMDPTEINQVAMDVLAEHKSVITDNLNFVSGSKKIDDLRSPDFYQDIFNLFVNPVAENMVKVTERLHKKLAETFPNKKIYKFMEFKFNARDMKLLDDTRSKLIKVI